MEDTLIGYILNELIFCSAHNESFFRNFCQSECVTRNNPFWNAASINFARKTSGHALVILNGTRNIGAFSNSSTFYKYELPELRSGYVQALNVLLVITPGQEIYETCSKPKTLTKLKEILDKKNILYLCEENSFNVLLIICYQNSFSRECKAIQYAINCSNNLKFFNSIFLTLIYLHIYLF